MQTVSFLRSAIRRVVLPALAGAILAASSAHAQDEAKLVLDWVPDGSYAAFYAGVAEGFYEEAGISLSIERGFGSSDTVTKIATGVAEFGIADIAAVMAGRVRAETPVKAIASVYTRPPHSIFVLADSGIETFKDLEGRSLAGAPGSAVRVYLPLVMARNDVDMSKVDLVNSEPATMGPLLVSGQADGVTGFLTNRPRFEVMAAEAGKEVRVLQFAESLQIYGNALIAAESTIAEAPDLTARFVAATIRSLEFARENPEKSVEAMMTMVPGLNPEGDGKAIEVHNFLTFDSDVARANPTGSFDAEQLAQTWAVVAEAQDFDVTAFDAEDFVSRDFLP